jgi:hypothetical protein
MTNRLPLLSLFAANAISMVGNIPAMREMNRRVGERLQT